MQSTDLLLDIASKFYNKERKKQKVMFGSNGRTAVGVIVRCFGAKHRPFVRYSLKVLLPAVRNVCCDMIRNASVT